MRRFIFLVLFSFLTINTFGQNVKEAKFEHRDSLRFDDFWKKFKTSLIKKDRKSIRQMSLNTINCNLCYPSEIDKEAISIDNFLGQFYENPLHAKFWNALITKKYRLNRDLNNIASNKNHVLYEVWYTTRELNEYAKGHEGESRAFQFIKTKNGFKLYGVTSVP